MKFSTRVLTLLVAA